MSTHVPERDDSPAVHWNLALAGGEGMRLSAYVIRRFGHHIPKQYCRLLGPRSMLEHTLDRLGALSPPSRTLAVIGADHAALAMPQLAGRCDHVFRQPCSRDTGIAILVALAMIRHWTPNAIATITPTDHYVSPDWAYVEQVRQARAFAEHARDLVVLLGARPLEPDSDLGYLSVGDPLPAQPRIRRVLSFVEKPSILVAKRLCARGALWNTMVICASATALWDLARRAEPRLFGQLDELVARIGTPAEDAAIERLYRTTLPVSFSREILEHAAGQLVTMDLREVRWSDWGRAERVEATLSSLRARSA